MKKTMLIMKSTKNSDDKIRTNLTFVVWFSNCIVLFVAGNYSQEKYWILLNKSIGASKIGIQTSL